MSNITCDNGAILKLDCENHLESIVLSDFYGPRTVGVERAKFELCEPEPKGWSTAIALGHDKRSIKEIYAELKPIAESASYAALDNAKDVQYINLAIGKKLSKPRVKWENMEKKHVEQLKLTNKVAINIEAWNSNLRNNEVTGNLHKAVYDSLFAHGYKIKLMNRSMGHNRYDNGIRLDSIDFRFTDMYIGELIFFEPLLPCGQKKSEATQRSNEFYKKHNTAPACNSGRDYCAVGCCERK